MKKIKGRYICLTCNIPIEGNICIVNDDETYCATCAGELIDMSLKCREWLIETKNMNPFLTWVDKDRRRLFNEQKD